MGRFTMRGIILLALAALATANVRTTEVWTQEQTEAAGLVHRGNFTISPLPHEYISDINLSVQHILNCGGVGSCHGGSVDGPYQWLHSESKKGSGISYDTSNPYMACSSESEEGFCKAVKWDCNAANIARTCSTFPPSGFCGPITSFPNATISEYGSISGAAATQKEILARGPIACGIDASPILKYTGGIAT